MIPSPFSVLRHPTSVLILLAVEALLILYFPPSLILEPTITAGGDTPSHFMSAVAIQNLSSIFSPVRWMHGNYGGYPLFLQYFPLPFMLMALISHVISLQVAFKLVTLLAILPLPPAVFYCLRRLGYSAQVAGLGAAFCLPFLVNSGQSMWGGNIPSTLAGEFAFGISLILTVVFTGRVYASAPGRSSFASNSLIEALIALGNGYPILQAGAGTSYFLIWGGCARYILSLHALAFGLIAFWILPLIRYSHWNSAFAHSWSFQDPLEFAPYLLWPSFAGALIGLAFHARKIPGLLKRFRTSSGPESKPNPEQYLWWQLGIALLGFSLATLFGIVDVRFLPFAQIFIVMLGAIGWGALISRLPRPNAWIAVLACAVMAFSVSQSAITDTWIRWNYSGMEAKPLWNSYCATNRFLEGTENSPRVVYEHSEIITGAGTSRAFEMLPYYSGRSTLEGLYMQSSVSSPFVFYIQSELSQFPSTPYPLYYYSRPDPSRAAEHLRLFNADQVIAVTDNIGNALDDSPEFEPEITFPPFRIYHLKNADNSYVTPLRFQPFRIPDSGWKSAQFEWFRRSSLKVPLIVASENAPGDYWKTVPALDGPAGSIPEIPLSGPGAQDIRASAHLGENSISITTSTPGHPLWIKVSYHPAWRISRGRGELYPASPAFMLLVPGTREVVLEFDTGSGVFLLGKIISLISLAILLGLAVLRFSRRRRNNTRSFPGEQAAWRTTWKTLEACETSGDSPAGPNSASPAIDEYGNSPPPPGRIFSPAMRLAVAAAIMGAVIAALLLTRNDRDPLLLYDVIDRKFQHAEELQAASVNGGGEKAMEREKLIPEIYRLINRCISKFPVSSVLDSCIYYNAYLKLDQRGDEARAILEDFIETHPETRILPECLYLIGESYQREGKTEDAQPYFERAALCWPESGGTTQAAIRLSELIGADAVLNQASELFDSGKYKDAYLLFKALSSLPDQEISGRANLALAYCCYYMNRFEEASNLFLNWLSAHFDSPRSPEAQIVLRHCNTIVARNRAWLSDGDDSFETPIGRILRFFKSAK